MKTAQMVVNLVVRQSRALYAALAILLIVCSFSAFAVLDTGDTTISNVSATTWASNTTGAVSLTVGTGKAIRIKEIRLGLSVAGGAGNLTAVIEDGDFATINVNVLTQDMTSASNVHLIFDGDVDLAIGDTLVVAYANANNRTYLIKVVWELL